MGFEMDWIVAVIAAFGLLRRNLKTRLNRRLSSLAFWACWSLWLDELALQQPLCTARKEWVDCAAFRLQTEIV